VVILKRNVAKAQGLLHYFNGKPSPGGHLSERFVRTGTCRACLREKTKAWQQIGANKAWNRSHAKQWADAHPERCAENKRKWRAANLEDLKQREIARSQKPERRMERRLSEAKRRAMKHTSRGTHTVAEVKALLSRQNGRCPYCHSDICRRYHIDHMMPLSRGGTNAISNIQLLCPSCNHRKYNKHPLKFAREIGLLL